ncbi:MAG: hypothetical protein JXB07_21365 [Anaerolineae bacterium]|nr:hypothetical protein [Anaerolineae bacterium]
MELARHWRLNNQRYTLTGSVCTCCGKQFVSPRPVCDVCHASEVSTYTFGKQTMHHEQPVPVFAMGQD